MPKIIIHKPEISLAENAARLSAVISTGEKDEVLWYEVSSEYAQYLTDTADAFLTAYLPYAMQHGADIEVEGAVSERLYFQLTGTLIPILAKYSKIFKKINIRAKYFTANNHCVTPHAATGFSRGVDSFDAVCQALEAENSQKLTHLTLFNVGSHRSTTGNTPAQAQELFRKRLEISTETARPLNLPIVAVNSNLGELLTLKYIIVHHFCSFSAVLALQKLFSSYYYASGFALDEFSIKKCDVCSAYYAPVLAQCLSTESTEFYISGQEKSRLDKVEFISHFPITYDKLNVCYYEEKNCGKCEKCIRTQYELYAVGKLDLYKGSFDVDSFYRNKDKYMDFVLRHQDSTDFRDILNTMRKNNLPLTTSQKLKKSAYSAFLRFRK